jgi:hypothetical protein
MPDTSSEYVDVPFRISRETAVELSKLDELVEGLNELKNVADTVLDRMRSQVTDSNHKLVGYIIFTKGFKSFQAAQLLCRSGYGSDALSLCASLFENIIDLLYIGKAPVRRSMRFIQFEQVEKFYKARKILKKKRLPRGVRKRYTGYMRSLTPQVAKVLKHFPDDSKGWSQKSLFRRAKTLGVRAELDYNEKYWIYCGHKHTLPMAVSGWTIDLPGGSVDVTCGPDAKEAFNAVKESAELFLQLCFIIDDIFSTSLKAQIEGARTKIGAAAEAVSQKYPELLN